MNMSFVILHYKAADETALAAESILESQRGRRFRVVIVDNGSGDGSGERLKAFFDGGSRVSTILLPENLGFARGNNAGIRAAREGGADAVCCLNSDVVISQRGFLDAFEREWRRTGAAVIGPMILDADGRLAWNRGRMKAAWEYAALKRRLEEGAPERKAGERMPMWLRKSPLWFPLRAARNSSVFRRKDAVLHGCCLLFTPAFFARLEGFDPRTFMYFEEELLFCEVKKAGLTTSYSPSLRATHLGGRSAEKAHGRAGAEEARRRMMAESLGVLLDEIGKDGAEERPGRRG